MSRMFFGRRQIIKGGGLLVASAAVPTLPVHAADPILRVGFQKAGGLLGVLKAQGSLEKTLEARGWRVSWHEFPAGPQLLEALNAGSVDFGYTGAPPPIFAQSAGKDIVYVGAESSGESTEAIVVKPGSAIKTVADLKGRQVAVQKGSSANYLLLATLRKAGLEFSDIRPVYLPPADARAAFESDRVDAWSVWDPYLAAIQAAIGVRVIADYRGLASPNSFYESSRGFVGRHADIVSIVLGELARVGAWAVANPAQVAEALAPLLGLPAAVVETWQRRTPYGVQPVDAQRVATQQAVADAFFDSKLIPNAVKVADAVWVWPRS